MKKLGNMLVLATSVIFASAANAALIGVEEGTSWKISGQNGQSNDFGLEEAIGTLGSRIVSNSDTPIRLTFEYLFKEADYTNEFYVNGVKVFSTNSTNNAPYSITWTGTGPLDFHFLVTNRGFKVTNSENSANDPANFWTKWDGVSNSLLIALDDYGNGDDDDYDDMIIRITATQVPEPATLALFGMGAMGLALARRRKQ